MPHHSLLGAPGDEIVCRDLVCWSSAERLYVMCVEITSAERDRGLPPHRGDVCSFARWNTRSAETEMVVSDNGKGSCEH
jgi:hypothetical protein